MSFSCAQKGIKKIYIAQILSIVATLLSSLASLIGFFALVGFSSYIDFLTSSFGIINISIIAVSAIAMILTAVLAIFGYIQASKDEPEFRKSMICIIIVAAFYIVSLFFKIPNSMLYMILNTSGTVFEMFVMAFSVSGIINLAVKCENEEMEQKGDRVMTFILVSFLASCINSIVYRIFELSDQAQTVAMIIGALDLLLTVSQFIVFMSYLRCALVMLRPEKKDE